MARRNVHIEQRIRVHSEKRLVVDATRRFISVSDRGGVASLAAGRHSAFFSRNPSLRATTCNWFMTRVRICTSRCRKAVAADFGFPGWGAEF